MAKHWWYHLPEAGASRDVERYEACVKEAEELARRRGELIAEQLALYARIKTAALARWTRDEVHDAEKAERAEEHAEAAARDAQTAARHEAAPVNPHPKTKTCLCGICKRHRAAVRRAAP